MVALEKNVNIAMGVVYRSVGHVTDLDDITLMGKKKLYAKGVLDVVYVCVVSAMELELEMITLIYIEF